MQNRLSICLFHLNYVSICTEGIPGFLQYDTNRLTRAFRLYNRATELFQTMVVDKIHTCLAEYKAVTGFHI